MINIQKGAKPASLGHGFTIHRVNNLLLKTMHLHQTSLTDFIWHCPRYREEKDEWGPELEC